MEKLAFTESHMQSSWVSFYLHLSAVTAQLRVPSSIRKWSAELPVASSRSRALSDYRLFVLASLVMKSWASLGKEELLAKTEHDPFPFPLQLNVPFCLSA